MAACLSALVMSCSKNGINGLGGGNMVNDTATTLLNVSYGSSAQQAADLYLPAGRDGRTRTIVLIHGGGWTGGDKRDISPYVSELQRRLPGYAVMNVNYRLVSIDSTYFPMQEQDVLSAMQFLKKQAPAYHVSDEVVLVGFSAGAHLALLQAYKHPDAISTRGVVSFFGPTDLSNLYLHYADQTIPWVLRKMLGGILQENPQAFEEASPVNFVTSSSPPTFLLHGDADSLVPVAQAYELKEKLDSAGVKNQLTVYPGAGHDGWSGSTQTDAFNKVQDFIAGL